MERLLEVEEKIKERVCPICFHANFGVSLLCSPVDRECIYMADCVHCGHRFPMNDTSRSSINSLRDLEILLACQPCPSCGNRASCMHFKWLMATKECTFDAECRRCGHLSRVSTW